MEIENLEATSESLFQNQDYDDKIELIQKAMHKLPHGYRIILSLHLIEGYKHKEIAGLLGISVSTSLSQFHRAK